MFKAKCVFVCLSEKHSWSCIIDFDQVKLQAFLIHAARVSFKKENALVPFSFLKTHDLSSPSYLSIFSSCSGVVISSASNDPGLFPRKMLDISDYF